MPSSFSNFEIALLTAETEVFKVSAAFEKLFNNSCQTLSIRSGHYPGSHTVFFDAPEDTVEMTHRARNREGFARGALEAALWILTKEEGFFTFDDFMKERVLCNR